MIYHITNICKRSNITTGTVHLYCDGKGAVNFLSTPKPYVKSSTSHFDILSAIVHLQNSTNIEWIFHHVKGHQDDTEMPEDLPQEAQLNIHADHIAKEKMTSMLTISQLYRLLL